MTSDPRVATFESLARMLAQTLATSTAHAQPVADRNAVPQGSIVVSGCGLGLPGAEKAVMDPDNALRILRGEQFVDLVPERYPAPMVNKRITRVVKAEDGGGSFKTITTPTT